MEKRKICIWCKYGEEKGNLIAKSSPKETKDCNSCPRCNRECISGTRMEFPNE